MYVRGSSVNTEYKREVTNFFRGIVIDAEETNKMLRVKVFIPELINHDFFKDQGFDTYKFGAPQKNTHLDVALMEKLKPLIPWAEQATPLMGEVGSSHWNHPSGMQWNPTNYGNPPRSATAKVGWGNNRAAQMPREALANSSKQPGNSIAGDKFINPKQTGLPYLNPSGSSYMPKNSGPRASGLYGRPQVGSQVWVFFEHGDLNFPIYFAGVTSYKETAQVNIPTGGPFENGVGETETDVEDTPPTSPVAGSGILKDDLPPNLQPLADDYVKYGQQYGVDPRFLAAISVLETDSGRSRAFREGNNAMGISNQTGVNYYRNDPAARSRTIEQMARSMASPTGYYRNATTIQQVGPIYAPSGAVNDPRGTNSGWARNVENIMRSRFGVEDPNNIQVINRNLIAL